MLICGWLLLGVSHHTEFSRAAATFVANKNSTIHYKIH